MIESLTEILLLNLKNSSGVLKDRYQDRSVLKLEAFPELHR